MRTTETFIRISLSFRIFLIALYCFGQKVRKEGRGEWREGRRKGGKEERKEWKEVSKERNEGRK